jgi:Leucine-rich repeat (LRR) protein
MLNIRFGAGAASRCGSGSAILKEIS